MALFHYSEEAVNRQATRVAQAHAKRDAAERAGAARQETEPAAAAAPKAWTPNLDAISDVDKGDPFLLSLAIQDQRAEWEQRQRAAGPGNEPKPGPAAEPVAPHKDSPGNEKGLSPAVMHAVQFLSEALSDGKSHGSAGLLLQAQKRGISEPTLRRARLVIAATTEKVGNAWLWRLSD